MIIAFLVIALWVAIFAEAIVATLVMLMRINHMSNIPNPRQQEILAFGLRFGMLLSLAPIFIGDKI